jgi:hypothetical protein
MNSSAIAFPEPPRGRPFGGGGIHRNGGLGALAPINLLTVIQVTHTNQRRAKKTGAALPCAARIQVLDRSFLQWKKI